MSNTATTDEEVIAHKYNPIYNPIGAKPVFVSQYALPTPAAVSTLHKDPDLSIEISDTQTTTTSSSDAPSSAPSSSTTPTPTPATTAPTNEVTLPRCPFHLLPFPFEQSSVD